MMDRRQLLGAGVSLAGLTALFPDGSWARTGIDASTARMGDRKILAKMLKATPRVGILAARVATQTGSYVYQSSAVGTGGWRSTLNITGLMDTDLRAVADAGIEDLATRMAALGRTLVPRAEILAHPAMAEFSVVEQPALKTWKYPSGGPPLDLAWASDSGGRLFFYHMEAWNPFGALAIKNWQRTNWVSKDLNAVLLMPTYVYTFGDTSLSLGEVTTNGAIRSQGARAEVSGGMKLVDHPSSVWATRGLIKIAGETSDVRFKGDLELGMPGRFESLGSTGQTANFAFQVDRAMFRAAALRGVQAMNQFTAEVFSQLG